MLAQRYEFYVLVARTTSHSFAALTREILFVLLEHKFISSCQCVISSVSTLNHCMHMLYTDCNHWSRGKQSGLCFRVFHLETRGKTKLCFSFETSLSLRQISNHSQSNVSNSNSIALNPQIVFN